MNYNENENAISERRNSSSYERKTPRQQQQQQQQQQRAFLYYNQHVTNKSIGALTLLICLFLAFRVTFQTDFYDLRLTLDLPVDRDAPNLPFATSETQGHHHDQTHQREKNSRTSSAPTHWNQDTTNGTIHVCGFDLGRLRESIFPEFQQVQRLRFDTQSTSNSLLFYGLWGPCPGTYGKTVLTETWVASKWKGKTVFINGESSWDHTTLNGTAHGMGSVRASPNSVHSTFMGLAFVAFYDPETTWPLLFDHVNKPQSTRKRFCIYTSTNCVDYREAAADRLTSIGPVFQGGKCGGANGTLLRQVKQHERQQRGQKDALWSRNYERFSKYRFCLVQENTNAEYYVTEKILNAFLGGCIPIYYGTVEVFEIFNPKAFIYYNISDPQPALDRVLYLEKNQSAYSETARQEPILAHGAETIEQYFSFSDRIGEGVLKRRLREQLGMEI